MSFFGLQSSEQRNITENNIKSSVSNASSNINDNTLLTNQLAEAKVKFENYGTLNCPHISIGAVATNENKQNIKVIAETHTDYDTTLTNNITNTMKNKVKQKNESLMGGGLFSSQVNNQLNQAINNTKNNISNKFFTKRTNMISTDQTGKAEVTVRNDGIIGCDGKDGTFDLRSEATNAVQTSFLLKTFDEESAKSGISNTITNTQSNVATQTSEGPFAAIIAIALFGCGYIYMKSGDDKMNKMGSDIKSKIPRYARVIISFIGLNILIGYSVYIFQDDDSYEIDPTDLTCDRTHWWEFEKSEYKLKPEFDEDDGNYNEDLYNYCSNLKNNMDEWGEKRKEGNFSATNTVINDSAETFNSIQQYNRINDSISLRGTIRELDQEGKPKDIDYTSLKLDPYSDVDCGDDGLKPGTDEPKTGCRTIKEDFIWEELIKKSCGCCRCDPNKIGYMKEWVDNTDNECFLDNTRKIGDFCDKNIDVIQPGSGYDTGTDYDTICRNEKYENKKCKKKNADGSIIDLEDDDTDNIKVSLISETECKGLNDSLVPGGICDNVGNDDPSLSGQEEGDAHPPSRCCYNEAPDSQDWSSVSSALFGKNSGTPCTQDGILNEATTYIGVCGPGCVKDDKCRIDYLNAMRNESNLAAGSGSNQPRDMQSQKDACPTTNGCIYKVKGVQEIKVTDVPQNHISDPDNIYTIKHKNPNSGPENSILNPVEFTHDGGIRNNADYLWQASSFIHFSDGEDVDYSLDNYAIHRNDPECSGLPDDIDYKEDGVMRPVNLCKCRFKRLPTCIKDENNEYLENLGCPDEIGIDGGSCLECIDTGTGSGVERRADYGKKLKRNYIIKLIISFMVYCIFSIWLLF